MVVLSTIGADAAQPNLLNALRLLEQALASVDLPITFLRAAWFMENAAWDVPSGTRGGCDPQLSPAARPSRSRWSPPTTLAVSRPTCFGRIGPGIRIVELEGPVRTSPNDLAIAFGKALGRPVVADAVPRADWERIFREQGMANPLLRMQMIDGFNQGWIDFAEA